MNYDFREATTLAEAAAILESWLSVSSQQIAYYRRERTKSFNGSYVEHVRREAEGAMQFLKFHCNPAAKRS